MKVIDKINNGLEGGNVVFSFEFFPPKTEEGVENLYDRMDRMVMHQPAFCDITWGAGGSTSAITLDIANKMQNMVWARNPRGREFSFCVKLDAVVHGARCCNASGLVSRG